MSPLWVGPCAMCGLKGSSMLTRSCPRCAAAVLRSEAASLHLQGNHPTAADKLEKAAALDAEVARG
jgi:hypothetical protein